MSIGGRPGALLAVTLNVGLRGAEAIGGTTGVWQNVTPGGISLSAGYSQTVGGSTDDNYGVQDILNDPVSPNVFYAFTCYQGMWRSVDWGATWVKRSTSPILDGGKNWGASIAPNGSYMLNTCGNNFSGSPQYRRTIQKSTDGGITWPIVSGDNGGDPYMCAISPYDSTRAIASLHDVPNLLESVDSGVTWSDMGTPGAASQPYVHYLHDSDTVLFVAADGGVSYRGTKSGGTWSWSTVTDLANGGHYHGSHQIYRDTSTGSIWMATGGGSQTGLWKSTNNGVNWTRVATTGDMTTIIAGTRLHAWWAAPISGGTVDCKWTRADLPAGTTWDATTDLNSSVGMADGPKRAATASDGIRRVIVAGCWCAGIWRYIEAL